MNTPVWVRGRCRGVQRSPVASTPNPDQATVTEQPHCIGHSAFGSCAVVPRFAVGIGPVTRYTCGRHLSWLIGQILTPGHSVTVTDIAVNAKSAPPLR